MKIERFYRGIAFIRGGIAFGGNVTWDCVLQTEDQEDEEVYIESEKEKLTIFVDSKMNKIYCSYVYNKEFDVYVSDIMDKYEQFVYVDDIDRVDFFEYRNIGNLLDKNFYVSLEAELEETGERIVFVKDMKTDYDNFPNTVEDFADIFPRDSKIYEYLKNDNSKVIFTMTLKLDKERQEKLLSTIKV